MSVYALQKMIRDVNRRPECREAYVTSKEGFAASYDLTDTERRAFVDFDVTKLYALGVHGLLLRPFTIINQMSEPAYLSAIRSAP